MFRPDRNSPAGAKHSKPGRRKAFPRKRLDSCRRNWRSSKATMRKSRRTSSNANCDRPRRKQRACCPTHSPKRLTSGSSDRSCSPSCADWFPIGPNQNARCSSSILSKVLNPTRWQWSLPNPSRKFVKPSNRCTKNGGPRRCRRLSFDRGCQYREREGAIARIRAIESLCKFRS